MLRNHISSQSHGNSKSGYLWMPYRVSKVVGAVCQVGCCLKCHLDDHACIMVLNAMSDLQIFPVAAVGVESWEALVQRTELYLGRDLLLHAAVTSGSVSMVTLILDLHDLFQ